jgi:hypothetical protein
VDAIVALPDSPPRQRAKENVEKDRSLLKDLDRPVDPATRGDPESPLLWSCKSVRQFAEELHREGHAASYQTVAELLHAMDYSLQPNQKALEGSQRIGIGSLNISIARLSDASR